MQVPKLEENQQTLQHLQQERLLYFAFFRYHMSLYFIKPYMDGIYTSRAFQRYQEHPNRSLYDKVMVLQSWTKNRKAAATSRRENQRRDVAESCKNDVATLPNDVATLLHDVETLPNDVATLLHDVATLLHDVATFGVGFGWIFSPF